MPRYREVAGVNPETGEPTITRVQFTPEEEAARDDEEAAHAAGEKDRLKAYSALKRRAREYGGASVTVGETSIPVYTDTVSQSKMTGASVAAMLALQNGQPYALNWKGSDGVFYPLDALEVIGLALGVSAFVQSGFDTEAAVIASIEAETITTTEQIDAEFEP